MKPRDIIKCDHLYIVCSDPFPNGNTLIVNITTRRDGVDQTCIVTPEDHEYIDHESVVAYNYAELASEKRIARLEMLASRPASQISEDAFKRILERGLLSKAATPEIKNALREAISQFKRSIKVDAASGSSGVA